MDDGKKLDFREQLGKLSPKERIYEELDRGALQENIYGFIPACDNSDTSLLLVNLGVMLAEKGKSVCIFDAKVFYPSIYKLADCEANPKGKGLLQTIKSDKADFREEISSTRHRNLYIMSASPSDAMEDYFDVREEEIERIISTLKDMFDIVLIDIPNIPPLEFCYMSMKCCNMGFVVWSERIECPQNTHRLLHFMNSIGVGVQSLPI
jgi:MinD-like ATPase involved in chromosome partitioning or flagellar assembly